MAGSERLRLFCALQLPSAVVSELAAWEGRELHGGRPVEATNLHVTLAFLGSRPAGDVAVVREALARSVAGTGPIRLGVRGYRETRSVGMLVLDDEKGRASELADRLHGKLEAAGVYVRESRPWLPHVTVVRFPERPRLRPRLPELGVVSPSDAAVYISRLRPGGAQYDVVEAIPLGGR